MSEDFYIYAHIDPNTGETFYIGKGRKNRAYEYRGRNPQWHEKVKSLNDRYEVKILERNLSLENSEELEFQYIKKYGKIIDGTGTLVNIADGMWGLREDLDFSKTAEEAFNQNLKDPEFVKNIETMSEIFDKMRNEKSMSETEIEDWYVKEISVPIAKQLEEEYGEFECDNCGLCSDLEELIDGKYCPDCKKKLR